MKKDIKVKEIQLKSILKIFVLLFMFYSLYSANLIWAPSINGISKDFKIIIGILILIEIIFIRKEK